METLSECKSSWYGTRFVICSNCKERAGYHHFFDSKTNKIFKCKCGKTLSQIKKDNQ